jgi:hypothetical protein
VVLHDITDDAELVEVTTTALGAERLLECDLPRKFTSEIIIIRNMVAIAAIDHT